MARTTSNIWMSRKYEENENVEEETHIMLVFDTTINLVLTDRIEDVVYILEVYYMLDCN